MRKFNIIAAITILSASMLTGCGKEIKEYNDSYIVASVKNGDSKLDYATASTYLRIMQAQTYDYVQNQLKEEELMLKEAELDLEKYKVDQDRYKAEQDNATKITVAQINSYRGAENMDQDMNGIPDPIEIGKQALE